MSMSGEPGTEQQQRRAGAWVAVLIVAAIIAAGVWLFSDSADSGDFVDEDSDLYSAQAFYGGSSIPNFSARDEQRLSEALAQLEDTYGSCFGWTLTDGATGNVQFGSSRGPDTRATTCSSWAEVRVAVGYTSVNSADYDAADISVATSADLDEAASITRENFVELGIDADTLIADPVGATGHAALALPLLLIQAGALQPVEQPPRQAGPSNPPRALPESDDLGFPVGTTLLLVALGAGAVAAIGAGIKATRRD